MTALSMSRMAVPYVALAAACGIALVFAIQYARREPPVDAKMTSAAPAASTPASGPQSRESAALAAAEAQANAVVRGLTGSPLPAESADGVPEFERLLRPDDIGLFFFAHRLPGCRMPQSAPEGSGEPGKCSIAAARRRSWPRGGLH